MALVREAGADRDLGQTELAVCSQELLCPLNAAVDHVLVRIVCWPGYFLSKCALVAKRRLRNGITPTERSHHQGYRPVSASW